MTGKRRGFTLVEILIVVVILGILAAVAIPQFTVASTQARESSLSQTLQSVRNQIELFKAEHNDVPPQITGMTNWGLLLNRSSTLETAVANPTGVTFGPYVQAAPRNPFNDRTAVSTATTDTNAGWYYTATTNGFELFARSADGTVNRNY